MRGKNSQFFFIALILPYIILQIPAVWYSVHTHFALIDDYDASWLTLKVFSSFAGIKIWILDQILPYRIGRFRPVFDIYNLLTWGAFGTHYALHHIARLCLKLAIIIYSAKTFSLFRQKGDRLNIPLFVFLSIFMFYPNNPEARLAPQELEMVFFLSVTLYFIAKLMTKKEEFSKWDSRWLVCSYAAFLLSKETSVFLAIPILIFLAVIKVNRKMLILLLCISGAALIEIGLAATTASETARITLNLITHNLTWSLHRLFLSNVLAILLLILLAIPLALKLSGQNGAPVHSKALTFYLFIWSAFLAYFLCSLTLYLPVLRYLYPLVYLLALLIGLGFTLIEPLPFSSTRLFRIAAISLCFYFVFSVYYDFIAQYGVQYATRKNESVVLDDIRQLMSQNKKVVFIRGDISDEYSSSMMGYFNNYLPFFTKNGWTHKLTIKSIADSNVYFV
ncbi:MAG: hypothetical protein M0018_02710, partial [Nitrospiraceae bacterium]|nr:hypothetical protein [Nitrospiraceae bacterium]